MKKNELLSALRSLQNNKNRTALAVTVGVMAMLLLLLSELLPSGNTQKTAASTVRTAAVSHVSAINKDIRTFVTEEFQTTGKHPFKE